MSDTIKLTDRKKAPEEEFYTFIELIKPATERGVFIASNSVSWLVAQDDDTKATIINDPRWENARKRLIQEATIEGISPEPIIEQMEKRLTHPF